MYGIAYLLCLCSFMSDGGLEQVSISNKSTSLTSCQENWFLLIFNALNAFALNVVIATSLKRMSAVAFVVIGVVKDGVIVVASSMIFDDPISTQQKA